MNDNEMNILIEDAFANYDTARLNDAHRGFEYIINEKIKDRQIEDVVYFSYRSLLCLATLDDRVAFVRVLHQLSTACLEEAARISAETIEKSDNLMEKIRLFELLERVLMKLNEWDNLEKLRDMLMKLYIRKSDEYDLSIENRIDFLIKISHLAESLNDMDTQEHYESKIKSEFLPILNNKGEDLVNYLGVLKTVRKYFTDRDPEFTNMVNLEIRRINKIN